MNNTSNSKSNQKPVDFILVITVLIMLALGVVMVLSASSPSALAETGNSYKYVITQGMSAVLGLALMAIISKIDYRIYKKFDKVIYFVTLILLVAVIIPGVGHSSGGATRWINLKFFQLAADKEK